MKATFEDFLNENPNCGGLSNNNDAIAAFNLLSEDESIFSLVESADQGRPALEGCVEKLETWYKAESGGNIDLEVEFTKKAIGRMVKTIIAPFGYEVTVRKVIAKTAGSEFFKTAACYEKTGKARLKVIKKIVEV